MIPRRLIENYTQGINGISKASRAALKAALESIDFSQPVYVIRDLVIEIMQSICGASTDAAAALSAEFYDGLREMEIGQRMGAVAASGREPKATEGAVRAFAEHLVNGNKRAFVTSLLGRVDYETKVAAAQTCLNNAKRDRQKPMFARVPTGTETCDFCLMLASRGFVYHTEAAASHAHSGCDCRVVPSWRSHEVEGYDPDALYDDWQDAVDAKAAKRAEKNGTDPADERQKIMDAYAEAAKKSKAKKKASGTQ